MPTLRADSQRIIKKKKKFVSVIIITEGRNDVSTSVKRAKPFRENRKFNVGGKEFVLPKKNTLWNLKKNSF